jgi:hypothetical protein
MRSFTIAVLIAVTAAPLASAQYRPRGSDKPEDALALPPRPVPGVAALVLEHAGELSLADSQRVVLEAIRVMQDSVNRPWVARLDSLRPTRVPANPNDLSPEQVEEIEARRQAIATVLEGMRETNALARQRAMAVLTPEQQERAADLENDARKRADEERARRARTLGMGMGEGRQGMGRPPED